MCKCFCGLSVMFLVSILIGSSADQPADAKKAPALLKAPFSEKEAKEAQEAWAKHLGRKVVEVVDLGGGVSMGLVLIPPGTFAMGSPKGEKDREEHELQHDVTLTKPFYLAKYPVTQEQYERIAGKSPSYFRTDGKFKDRVANLDTKQFPVEAVSWDDADGFCQTAAKKVTWGKLMLPTEAQWEYACRAGTETPFYFGDVLDGDQANCDGNYPYGTTTKGPCLKRTCKVGGDPDKEYKPNNFGLYDMHGNVWQWCLDYYGPYDGLKKEDPVQLDKDTQKRRVLRGGSWGNSGRNCRAANRYGNAADDRYSSVGFRVAVILD
jgi:formylglycine-generating enzyme required for sulfatase activity